MELIINKLQIIESYSPFKIEDVAYAKSTGYSKYDSKASNIKWMFDKWNISNSFFITTETEEYFYRDGYLLNSNLKIVGIVGRLNRYVKKHLTINNFKETEPWELFLDKRSIDSKLFTQIEKYCVNINVNSLSNTMFNLLLQSKVSIPQDGEAVKIIVENYLKAQFRDITNLDILNESKTTETNLFTGTEEVIEAPIEETIFDLEEEARDESDYQTCDRCENEYHIDEIQDDGICNNCHAEEDEEEYEEEEANDGGPFQ